MYVKKSSRQESTGDIFARFDFYKQIGRLAKANLRLLVTEKPASSNRHPEVVNNARMGVLTEDLIFQQAH